MTQETTNVDDSIEAVAWKNFDKAIADLRATLNARGLFFDVSWEMKAMRSVKQARSQ